MLYNTDKLICRSIANFTDEKKQSDTVTVLSTAEDVSPDLYSLIRWILVGPEEELQTDMRRRTVGRSALPLTQAVYIHIPDTTSPRKSTCSWFRTYCSSRHQEQDPLHSQNYCVPYGRSLLLETDLANAVVEITRRFDGLYVPPFLQKGTFVFSAVDNTNFAEDTADGKCTTHGTITAVYPKAIAPGEVIAPRLELSEAKNLSVAPYHVPIKPCSKPKPGLAKRAH